MQRMGVDLHKRESQLAINAADGTITDSEWVGRHLESLGHEVIGAVRVSGVVPRGAGRARRTSPPHVGASGSSQGASGASASAHPARSARRPLASLGRSRSNDARSAD